MACILFRRSARATWRASRRSRRRGRDRGPAARSKIRPKTGPRVRRRPAHPTTRSMEPIKQSGPLEQPRKKSARCLKNLVRRMPSSPQIRRNRPRLGDLQTTGGVDGRVRSRGEPARRRIDVLVYGSAPSVSRTGIAARAGFVNKPGLKPPVRIDIRSANGPLRRCLALSGSPIRSRSIHPARGLRCRGPIRSVRREASTARP